MSEEAPHPIPSTSPGGSKHSADDVSSLELGPPAASAGAGSEHNNNDDDQDDGGQSLESREVEMEDNNENENENEAEMDDTQPVSGPSPTAGLAAKVNPPKGGKGKTGQSKAGAKQAAQGKKFGSSKSVGASGLGKGKGYVASRQTKKKRVTKTFRAGLLFPVGRMRTHLRKFRYSKRVSDGAVCYLAAVVEYLAAELLELAGNAARDNGRIRIIPRHVLLAIRQDAELSELVGHETIIPMSGVMPNIHVALLPQKKKSVVQPAGAPGGKAQSGGAAGAMGSSNKKSKSTSSKGSSKGAGKGKGKGKGGSTSSKAASAKMLATKSGAGPGQKSQNNSSQQQDSREY